MRTIDCDEAIQEIAGLLAEAEGEFIAEIYSQVSSRDATYTEDSIIEVEE